MPSGNRLSREERLDKRAELELGLRTCSICFLQKPLSDFYTKSDKPFLMSACKTCVANKQKEKRKEKARSIRLDLVIKALEDTINSLRKADSE